ncbi:hypothetical protein HK100_006023 [Physocladia obscura]|uniref:Uncharacterized protein n=1 Tax=Physocladia obscura TaxID=109957 RepID=A0AAD5SR17_9FUNG|nr:hypothetical protein HK100_006023 [Physocladia obscura]
MTTQMHSETDPEFRNNVILIPRTSYFAVSANDEFMAYGALLVFSTFRLFLNPSVHSSSSIYVWNLTEKRLLHEILIPAFKNRIIAQIEFVGNSAV